MIGTIVAAITNIYILRQFVPKSDGDGGSKRTYQIQYLLTQWLQNQPQLQLVPIEIARRGRKLNTWLRYLLFRLGVNFRSTIYSYFFQKQSLVNGYYCFLALQNIPANAIVIWENVYPDYYFIAKAFSYKLIALPHNLEALVPNQHLSGFSKDVFANTKTELSVLKACSVSATISYEEHWLQSLHGINSSYLPYFPVGEIAQNCLNVSINRSTANSTSYNVLINGSATNPPTLAGMTALLKFLQQAPSNITYHVCGFGTEQLTEFQSRHIKVLGSVTQEQLNKLYSMANVAIVNQGFSTGVLTKIPELIAMGIPVLACEGSSRSFYGYTAVYTYQNFTHLLQLLETRPVLNTTESVNFEQTRHWNNFFNTHLLGS